MTLKVSMHSSELKRVKAIFVDALEMSGTERQAFVDQACAGDSALRNEVIAYLDASVAAGSSLDSPPQSRLLNIADR